MEDVDIALALQRYVALSKTPAVRTIPTHFLTICDIELYFDANPGHQRGDEFNLLSRERSCASHVLATRSSKKNPGIPQTPSPRFLRRARTLLQNHPGIEPIRAA